MRNLDKYRYEYASHRVEELLPLVTDDMPATQPDPNKHCYGYTAEYADAGHGNYKAADFIAANNNQDGGDIRILADVNPNARLIIAQSDVDILLSNESFNSFGVNIENNIFEAAGTINNGTHWVNIIGISSYDKMSWFGGVISHHNAFKIWNPIGGITSWINSSGITSLRIFKY